jgi:hypothetical protein
MTIFLQDSEMKEATSVFMLFSANTKCGHFHINKPRHGAMVSVVVLSAVDRGLEPRLKTIKLIVAASPLRTQH